MTTVSLLNLSLTITVRHLLNMSSGLSWEEDTEVLDAIEHRIPNPVQYILDKELVAEPATQFNYNSLSPHVVAHILAENTQQSLLDLSREKLFEPLGIQKIAWSKDPQGAEWGGFGLQLTARDLAKFGQLYLNGGTWQGTHIVPRKWVEQSAIPQIQPFSPTTGYSLQWWTSENLDLPIYYGQGYGGQALMIVPGKNLIVVAVQHYLVTNEQHIVQWNNFVQKVFLPVYNAAK